MADAEQDPANLSHMLSDILTTLQESADVGEITEAADVDALIKQMESTLADLNEKAEQVYQATGMNKEELQEFSQKKENFSEEEWKLLSDVREQVQGFEERAEEIMAKGLGEIEAPTPKPKTKGKGGSKTGKRVKRKDWTPG